MLWGGGTRGNKQELKQARGGGNSRGQMPLLGFRKYTVLSFPRAPLPFPLREHVRAPWGFRFHLNYEGRAKGPLDPRLLFASKWNEDFPCVLFSVSGSAWTQFSFPCPWGMTETKRSRHQSHSQGELRTGGSWIRIIHLAEFSWFSEQGPRAALWLSWVLAGTFASMGKIFHKAVKNLKT